MKAGKITAKGVRPSRRRFLFAAIGAVVAAGTYAIVTRRRWVDAGLPSKIPSGTFLPFMANDAYAFLQRMPDGVILALSQRCTHRGCLVAWNDTDREFHCPCHKGIFNASGVPISGPPRRPLERLQTRLQNGDLEVFM